MCSGGGQKGVLWFMYCNYRAHSFKKVFCLIFVSQKTALNRATGVGRSQQECLKALVSLAQVALLAPCGGFSIYFENTVSLWLDVDICCFLIMLIDCPLVPAELVILCHGLQNVAVVKLSMDDKR